MPGRGLLLWATTTPTQVELNISSFPFLTSLGGQLNIQHTYILFPISWQVLVPASWTETKWLICSQGNSATSADRLLSPTSMWFVSHLLHNLQDYIRIKISTDNKSLTIIVNFLQLTRRFEWFFIIPRNFIICPLLPLYEPQTFLKSCDNPFLQLTAAHCVVGGHTPVAVRLGVSRLVGQKQIFSDWSKAFSWICWIIDIKRKFSALCHV